MNIAVDNLTSSTPAKNLISPIASEVALGRGIPVIPIPRGSKACKLKDWPNQATTSTSTLAMWHRMDATYNYGCVAKPDGFCVLDFDSAEAMAVCEAETGHELPRTFVVKTAKGSHAYFKHTDASRVLGNQKWVRNNMTMFDFQAEDKYVIAPGSLHPSGIRYEIVDDSEIIPIPDWLVDWIRSKARGHEPENRHGGKGDVPNAHRRLFEDWLVQHNVDFTLTKQESESHTYGYRVNSGCPLAERHTNPNGPDDFYVFLSSDGYGAKCMHTSCGEWTWGRYRCLLEESDGKRIPLLPASQTNTSSVTTQFNTKQFLFHSIGDGFSLHYS